MKEALRRIHNTEHMFSYWYHASALPTICVVLTPHNCQAYPGLLKVWKSPALHESTTKISINNSFFYSGCGQAEWEYVCGSEWVVLWYYGQYQKCPVVKVVKTITSFYVCSPWSLYHWAHSLIYSLDTSLLSSLICASSVKTLELVMNKIGRVLSRGLQ